jgi:hypothetical protein
MSRLARGAAVAAFALAYLSQPLALDACSVSCEAARAARSASIAAPCHHSTSCATQISQPTSPGSTERLQAQAPPPIVALTVNRPTTSAVLLPLYVRLASSSPPTSAQLRV